MTISISSSPSRPQECYSVKFSHYHSESAVFTRSINRTCGLCAVEGLETRRDPTWTWRRMIVFYHDFDSNVLYLLQAQSPYCQLSQTAWKQCSVYLSESPRAPWVFSDEIVSLQSLTHAHKLCDIIKYSVLLVLLKLLTEVLYWNTGALEGSLEERALEGACHERALARSGYWRALARSGHWRALARSGADCHSRQRKLKHVTLTTFMMFFFSSQEGQWSSHFHFLSRCIDQTYNNLNTHFIKWHGFNFLIKMHFYIFWGA